MELIDQFGSCLRSGQVLGAVSVSATFVLALCAVGGCSPREEPSDADRQDTTSEDVASDTTAEPDSADGSEGDVPDDTTEEPDSADGSSDVAPDGAVDAEDDCLLHPFGERCCGDAAASEPRAYNFMGCYCDLATWDRLPSTPRKVCCVGDSELSCGRGPGDPQGVGRWVVLSIHDGTCSESVTPQCTVELMRQYTLDARDVEADGGDE